MGELMTEQCATGTYGRSARGWSTTTAGRGGGAPRATGGTPWTAAGVASPNDWVGATMDADDVDVTGWRANQVPAPFISGTDHR